MFSWGPDFYSENIKPTNITQKNLKSRKTRFKNNEILTCNNFSVTRKK